MCARGKGWPVEQTIKNKQKHLVFIPLALIVSADWSQTEWYFGKLNSLYEVGTSEPLKPSQRLAELRVDMMKLIPSTSFRNGKNGFNVR